MSWLFFIFFGLLTLIDCRHSPGFLKTINKRRLKSRGGSVRSGGSYRSGTRSTYRSSSRSSFTHYSSYRSTAIYYYGSAHRRSSEPDVQDYSVTFTFNYEFDKNKILTQNISKYNVGHTNIKNIIVNDLQTKQTTYKIFSVEDNTLNKNNITYSPTTQIISGSKLVNLKIQIMNTLSKKNKREFEQWLNKTENITLYNSINEYVKPQTSTALNINNVNIKYTTKEEMGAAGITLIVFGCLICCFCGFCGYYKYSKNGGCNVSCDWCYSGSSYDTYEHSYEKEEIGLTNNHYETHGVTNIDNVNNQYYGPNCPGNCGIKRYTDTAGYYDCNICDYNAKPDDIMYGCRSCDYDLCEKCFMNKCELVSREIYDCTNKHGLRKFTDSTGFYDCNICDYNAKPNDIMYGCRMCDYDICDNCFSKKENEINSNNAYPTTTQTNDDGFGETQVDTGIIDADTPKNIGNNSGGITYPTPQKNNNMYNNIPMDIPQDVPPDVPRDDAPLIKKNNY